MIVRLAAHCGMHCHCARKRKQESLHRCYLEFVLPHAAVTTAQ